MIWEPLAACAATMVAGYVALIERRIANMQSKIDKKISLEEAEHLIDLKQATTDARLADLKEDLKEMKQDLKDIKGKL